jgi:hypothetical protein
MTIPDDLLQERLQQLPDASLPDGLWQRVNGARRRKQRRRIGIAATTVAVATVAALSPLMRPAPVISQPAPVVAAAPSLPPGVDAELRALDRALQAGYARNATDAELEPLWAQRRQLLAGSDAHPNTPLPRSLRI